MPSEVAHLGGTLAFTATKQLTTGLQKAAIHITLDDVIDPAPPEAGSGVGYRNVELRVTIANVGDVTVPDMDEGDEYVLSIEWALDPDRTNDDDARGLQFEGLPSASCGSTPTQFVNGVAPGQSVTGCVPFDLGDGVAVTSASARLLYAGYGDQPIGEWLIP
jgi:hypothetical protein